MTRCRSGAVADMKRPIPWLHEVMAPSLVLTGENDGGCNVMEVNFLRLKDERIALFHCQKNSESGDCRVMMRTSLQSPYTTRVPQGRWLGVTTLCTLPEWWVYGAA